MKTSIYHENCTKLVTNHYLFHFMIDEGGGGGGVSSDERGDGVTFDRGNKA